MQPALCSVDRRFNLHLRMYPSPPPAPGYPPGALGEPWPKRPDAQMKIALLNHDFRNGGYGMAAAGVFLSQASLDSPADTAFVPPSLTRLSLASAPPVRCASSSREAVAALQAGRLGTPR